MNKSYKLQLQELCGLLDLFGGKINFTDLCNMPIPFLEDFKDAQIQYLKDKAEAEKALIESEKNKVKHKKNHK